MYNVTNVIEPFSEKLRFPFPLLTFIHHISYFSSFNTWLWCKNELHHPSSLSTSSNQLNIWIAIQQSVKSGKFDNVKVLN